MTFSKPFLVGRNLSSDYNFGRRKYAHCTDIKWQKTERSFAGNNQTHKVYLNA